MIYLDNAATTNKKPRSVIRACDKTLKYCSANSGRGGHQLSMRAAEKIYSCREALSNLFGAEDPTKMVLTNNATTALNIAIRGILSEGKHALLSGAEHNSVLRPAVLSGAEISFANPEGAGLITPESVKKKIKKNTALIVVTHKSNVTGAINPVNEIADIASYYGIPFLIDAAQTAGNEDIDVKKRGISLVAFAGHKGLYGPTGTGGLYVSEAELLHPFITGGSGSFSESEYQPPFLPDRFESGTLNVVGFAGLSAGVRFVLKKGVSNIRKKEKELCQLLYEGLSGIDGIKIFSDSQNNGILSFLIDSADSVEIANILDSEFKIAVRGGLHCSPLIHKFLGTSKTGLVRMSVGFFNTEHDIICAIDAVRKIKKKYF